MTARPGKGSQSGLHIHTIEHQQLRLTTEGTTRLDYLTRAPNWNKGDFWDIRKRFGYQESDSDTLAVASPTPTDQGGPQEIQTGIESLCRGDERRTSRNCMDESDPNQQSQVVESPSSH